MIVEELGVNRTDPNMSRSAVTKQFEDYASSGEAAAIQGALLWRYDIANGIKQCPDPVDPCAIFADSPDYAALVTQFATAMTAKGELG